MVILPRKASSKMWPPILYTYLEYPILVSKGLIDRIISQSLLGTMQYILRNEGSGECIL